MHTPAHALTWEFLRRTRWWILGCIAFIVGFMYNIYQMNSPSVADYHMKVYLITMMFLATPVVGGLVVVGLHDVTSRAAGLRASLHTLPLSDRTIVNISFIHLLAMVPAVYLPSALLLRWWLGLRLPIFFPLVVLWVVAFWVAMIMTMRPGGRKLLVVLGLAALLLRWVILDSSQITKFDIALALGLIPIAWLGTLRGFALARHQPGLRVKQTLPDRRGKDIGPKIFKPFSTPAAALAWFGTNGDGSKFSLRWFWFVPAALLVWACWAGHGIWVLQSLPWMFSYLPINMLVATGDYLLDKQRSSFQLTLPLRNDELTSPLLRFSFRHMFNIYLGIAFLALLTVAVELLLRGRHPALLAELRGEDILFFKGHPFGYAILPLLWLVSLTTAWVLNGLALTARLYSSAKGDHTVLFLAIIAGMTLFVMPLFIFLLFCLVLALFIWLFHDIGVALRQKTIRTSMLLVPPALTLVLGLLMWNLVSEKPGWLIPVALFSLLALAPHALTPQAMASARHR